MIRDLNAFSNVLSVEGQTEVVLGSLPESRDIMKLTMMHNEYTTTFSQLSYHLEREEEEQGFQTDPSVCVAKSSQGEISRFKHD